MAEGGEFSDELLFCDLCCEQNECLNAVCVFNTDLIVCTKCLDVKVTFGFQSEKDRARESELTNILLAERNGRNEVIKTSVSCSDSSSHNDKNQDYGDNGVKDYGDVATISSLNLEALYDKNDTESVDRDDVGKKILDVENKIAQDRCCAGQSYRLFLIGKTGHGKSSTGNSILGQHAFHNDSSASSVTRDIQAESCTFNGISITVVDGPGIGDTNYTEEQDIVQALRASSYAMEVSHSGFDAMLLVLSYPLRFTKEEIKTVDIIRALFGKDILQTHGIVVFTHGDNFNFDEDDDDEDEDEGHRKPKTFDEWCRIQKGKIQLLFEECNHRHIVFNNKTKNDQEKKEQINQLLTLCRSLKAEQEPYSIDRYKQNECSRNELFVRARQSRIEAITDTKLERFRQRCRDNEQKQRAKERFQLWSSLLREASTFHDHLQKEARGTKLLDHVIQKVDEILSYISNRRHKDQQEERKDMENRNDRIKPQQGRGQIYQDALKAREENFNRNIAKTKAVVQKNQLKEQEKIDRLAKSVMKKSLDLDRNRKDQGRRSNVCTVM